jgi:hypothetical protein
MLKVCLHVFAQIAGTVLVLHHGFCCQTVRLPACLCSGSKNDVC